VSLLLLLACGEAPEAERASPFVPLDELRLARRLSLDIRGVLPSAEELETAEASGAGSLVDGWMRDPRFEEHLADAFAEDWMLHTDRMRVDASEFGLSEEETWAYTRAFGDEPARLMARIVAEDRPWSEIVTGDTTVANDMLASLVPLDLVDGDDTRDWREARYLDGRPPLGVLATSGLWLRFPTTIFNYNRGRAAAIGRLLLCHDVLARPVPFAAAEGTSTEELAEAVASQSGCIACHAGLDPLASALFGFYPYEDLDGTELVTYHPDREVSGAELTGAAPGYFGTRLDGVAQLGDLVASDPRFPMCTARRTAERLWARPTDLDDLPELVGLRDTLQADDRYRPLLQAVLATPEYRAGGLVDGADEAAGDRYRPIRFVSPLTLRSAIEEATGFRWTWEGWDELDSDHTGYRLLLGGADGDLVRQPHYGPSVSRALVLRRLAQAAARTVVEADLAADPGARRLFSDLDLEDPSAAALDAELDALHLRLLATRPDPDRRAALRELWTGVRDAADTRTAWASVVTSLLRDPEFWTY